MTELLKRLERTSREYAHKVAADGRDAFQQPPPVLPPSEWESVRLIMQARLRAFTGEPGAIVRFEFPTDASL